MSDLRNINWQGALEINRTETKASFIKFYDIFELLLDSHAPLKKHSCSEAKFYLKPWITPAIRKSMIVRGRLQKMFLRAKAPIQKNVLHNEAKQYWNYINLLQEIAKQTTTKNFSKITKKSSQNMGRGKNDYKDQ